MRDIAASRGTKLAIVIVPPKEDLHLYNRDVQTLRTVYRLDVSDYDFTKPNRIITEFAAENRIPVLDLLPSFIEATKSKRLYWYHDGHWNAEGHRLAAEEIYRFLLERGLLLR